MENVEKSEEAANLYIECPAINENSACPCYKFEDGELHPKICPSAPHKYSYYFATWFDFP